MNDKKTSKEGSLEHQQLMNLEKIFRTYDWKEIQDEQYNDASDIQYENQDIKRQPQSSTENPNPR